MLRGNPLGVVKIGENASPALLGEIATPGRSSIKRQLMLSPDNEQDRPRKFSVGEAASPDLRQGKIRVRRNTVALGEIGHELNETENSKITPVKEVLKKKTKSRIAARFGRTSKQPDEKQRLISSLFPSKSHVDGQRGDVKTDDHVE